MALVHEFFPIAAAAPSAALAAYYAARPEAARRFQWPEGPLLEEALALDRALTAFYETHRRRGLELHDDLIQKHFGRFAQVPALFNGVLPNRGLNYYAITLFRQEHLGALRAAADVPELVPLADLCRRAEADGMDIVHFGI